jgi:hypothetical protein
MIFQPPADLIRATKPLSLIMKWSVRNLPHLTRSILFIIKDVFEIGDIETQNHPVDPKPLLPKKLPELYPFSDRAIRCDPSVQNFNVLGF